MCARITGALDDRYNTDQGTVTGDIDESGYDDSNGTKEEETDVEDDEAVINFFQKRKR